MDNAPGIIQVQDQKKLSSGQKLFQKKVEIVKSFSYLCRTLLFTLIYTTMAHYLFSMDSETMIASFDKFNKEAIKKAIIGHLNQFPNDCVEHCKDFSSSDIRKYYGHEILNFYKVNVMNSKISKVVTKDNRTLYVSIEN